MRRLGRFVSRRGLGHTLAILALVASVAGTLSVATRTAWHLPLISNLLLGLVAACGLFGIACYLSIPQGRASDEVTEIEAAPDPDVKPNSEGNVADDGESGPVIEVPRGSKAKVPRTSKVRIVDSDKEDPAGDESQRTEEGDP